MLSVLRRCRDFRRLWSAGLLSVAGSEITRVAVLLYLAREFQHGGAIALWMALRAVPGVLATPWIGMVVDRYDHRRLLIASDVGRALLLLLVAAYPRPWVLLAVATGESLAAAVFEPARRALLPRLVADAELERANGVTQGTSTVLLIACPVIGAQVFLTFGLPAALTIDAVTFMASAALVARITPPAAPRAPVPRWALAQVGVSWAAVAGDARVRVIAAVLFVSVVCTGLWAPLAPFFIRDVLRVGEAQLGWQFAAFGIGGAAGALVAPALAARWSSGTLFLGALLLEGVHMIAYATIEDWRLSLLCMAGWGAAVSLIAVSSVSYVQRTLPADLLGRVFTAMRQAEQVGMLVAMALAALLAASAPRQVFAAAGVLYVVLTLWAAVTPGGRALWRRAAVTPRRPPAAAIAAAPGGAEPAE